MRRLEKTNPEARENIKIIWQSPLIPSDPLVWRQDLDPELKQKVYTFILTYGRLGTPEDVKAARAVLDGLQWAPFRPSSNAQLYPIRLLAISKEMNNVMADDKLSEDEKNARLSELKAEKAKYDGLMASVPQS
jgi:phosphonate transport system substrate-binding protein